MEDPHSTLSISVIWRGKKFMLEMNSGATLKEFGQELQKLTHVKADTMRLIVPQSSNKNSNLFSPFSDEHSCLSLLETSISKRKSIRMMGVSEDEVDGVLQSAKADQRIAGFDEDKKRMRQRTLDRPHASLKLPHGTYIFCDFRTLQIPGIELNPPALEALQRMHMLAADPGIVAIMNKYRWRVGIMTEMAPVGYVGISPKCILGFNKNHGEEISLRLRTDDLKGFRKYESIKKTLLHELAHMIYSEHDANFYALDGQLNKEAASLDWTKSRSHTLSGVKCSEHYEEEFHFVDDSNYSYKLGGNTSDQLASARASSVAAAFRRLTNASTYNSELGETHEEPDPDESKFYVHGRPGPISSMENGHVIIGSPSNDLLKPYHEPDPDDCSSIQSNFEPDSDGLEGGENMESDPHSRFDGNGITSEPDFEMTQYVPPLTTSEKLATAKICEEPDPDDTLKHNQPDLDHTQVVKTLDISNLPRDNTDEPDPDDSEAEHNDLGHGIVRKFDQDDSIVNKNMERQVQVSKTSKDSYPNDFQTNGVVQTEPDPDDNLVFPLDSSRMQTDEPDPDDAEVRRVQVPRAITDELDTDDAELRRIQDPVTIVCSRLLKAIEMLQSEVNPAEVARVVQSLFKIIRNLIEHPEEMKFKRLRMANPIFQRTVANYKAALEVLSLIGFIEDVVLDDIGKAETYLVLKRNDPGLLWLAKSSLETCITH